MLAERVKRIETVLDYHRRTKHQPDRYARSMGYLDWDSQPYPWREFEGARRIVLPLAEQVGSVPFNRIFSKVPVDARPLTSENIGLFLELSLGLTAWKLSGPSRWALRANPSSGNLHPTEGYLFLPPVDGIAVNPTLCHYMSRDHFLEERCAWPSAEVWPADSFAMALSSITWREEWKYGERAFRYCQHDIGHALAAIRISAACLGWSMRLLWNWNEEDLARWLGLDRTGDFDSTGRETPECFFQIGIGGNPKPFPLVPENGQYRGKANRLSQARADWPVVEEVKLASRHCDDHDFSGDSTPHEPPPLQFPQCGHAMENIIRQRRSAVAFDAGAPMALNDFLGLLDLTMPRAGVPPFDMGTFDSPKANLILFVHRVKELEPGVYCWIRGDFAAFIAALDPEFQWKKVRDDRPLYLLGSSDVRDFARTVCCGQDIAADSSFSLGMLLPFEATIRQKGADAYRLLFWEAGIIGQLLYLGAEALGYRGTGIGCYFDDVMHHALGIQNAAWQSLYHFTVGNPLEDPRLQTIAPYDHVTAQATLTHP
jgi:nitroreductase